MPKLNCFAFGQRLLETNDLDPVYVLLWNCDQLRNNPELMKRWLLAYWCFYHMGTASWIVEGGDEFYWDRFMDAADSKNYPRCRERRHFRGMAAITSVQYLWRENTTNLFEPLVGPGYTHTCRGVMHTVQKWRGFGPWIAFKAADMLERLALAEVAFNVDDVYLFDSPRKGAEELRHSLSADVSDEELNEWAIKAITYNLWRHKAPPRYERVVNAQEAETILCKWHSYMNNHYKIGEDVESCHKSLQVFQNPLAKKLLEAGKVAKLW